jgi:hypothetical protein
VLLDKQTVIQRNADLLLYIWVGIDYSLQLLDSRHFVLVRALHAVCRCVFRVGCFGAS